MKRSSLALLLALVAACSDDPSGPEPVADVSILLGARPAEEQALQVGGTVKLSASTRDLRGAQLQGRQVSWRSTVLDVATVDTSGLVTAVGPGTALIIASADASADTVRVRVSAPPSDLVACNPGDVGLNLAVGEVYTATADEAQILCLNAGASGSEYTYVPFNATASITQRLQVEVAGGGLTTAAGPPNPTRISASRSLSLSGSASRVQRDTRFHARKLRDNQELFERLKAQGGMRRSTSRPSFSMSGAAADLVVGQLYPDSLNVNAESGCLDPIYRPARVEAISQRAIVVADTSNPAGGLTRSDFQSLAAAFDTLVYPVDVKNFGTPNDLDENGKVLIFFTRAVNDLTEEGSGSFIGGFFFGRDLFPRGAAAGQCAGSNEAELFYLMVPDTARAGSNANSPFTAKAVLQNSVGVIAHEFQHLINFSRRLANDGVSEAVWLNEGLSHIAEELLFYEVTDFGPRQNIDVEAIRTSRAVIDAFNGYAVDNFARYINYLEEPEAESLMGEDNLPTRGAIWAFLRYAADRRNGDDSDLWFRLVNSYSRSGLENLDVALGPGVSALDWMQDWTVSVYTDDTDVPVQPRFTQPSWDYRAIYGVLTEGYPLKTIPVTNGGDNDVELRLRAGGAAFLRFGIVPAGRAAVRTTSGGLAAPERLRISIVRTR